MDGHVDPLLQNYNNLGQSIEKQKISWCRGTLKYNILITINMYSYSRIYRSDTRIFQTHRVHQH
jgi:hypothetical protein